MVLVILKLMYMNIVQIWGGYAYSVAYTLAQRGIFSSLFTDEYGPFNPNYYYDGINEWAVNPTGCITGKYVNMPFVPVGGGKGGLLGLAKEHTKNARQSTKGKHQAGQKRQQVDYGGERGDANRRPLRQKPNGWKRSCTSLN